MTVSILFKDLDYTLIETINNKNFLRKVVHLVVQI
jgi:hypothetical protein